VIYCTTFISQDSQLTATLQNPESIVGSRVDHLFVVSAQETKWYSDLIINYHPSTKQHEIKYDEEEEHCFFDLTVDLASGDLIVKS